MLQEVGFSDRAMRLYRVQALKKAGLRKLLEKKADIKAKEDQIAAAISDVQQLRQRVASQTVNKADVNRMIMERCADWNPYAARPAGTTLRGKRGT